MHPVTPAGVLAGRASELALLDGYLRELTRRSGGAMLIEGEPGIGKPALARTALAGLPPGDCQVFWGAGDELGQELPLLPFLDALQVRRPSANARRATIAGLLRGEVATDRGADVPATIAEQLIALTIDETSARPVVLVIDDLQWADAATVKLWGRLARTARQVPLLLIGLTRPVAQREDLLALRRGVDEDARLQLAALSPAAVAELVCTLAGGRPDGGLLGLAAGAAGNPLYLTELLAALERSGGIAIHAGTAQLAADRVPNSLPAAIADRLGFVSTPTRDVLRAAALLGVEFAVTDLTTVLGRGVADLVPALDEARATGVLTDVRGGLAFRHPLIREALYAELPAAVRSAWHRDAGQALAAAGAPPDRVARQLLRSIGGLADDGSAPAALADATSGAAGGAIAQAGQDTPAVPALPGDRHGKPANPAAGTASATVSPAIQIERPPIALDVARSAEPIDAWVLEWLVTSAESLVGQAPGVAAELLGQAVAGIPAGSFRHGWLTSRLADSLYRTGERAMAEQVAARTLISATDPDLVVDLHWTLAQCRMLAGKSEQSFETLAQALVSPGISAKHRARLRVLAARTYLYFGRVEDSAREADNALASATEAADTWATGWSLHVLAISAAVGGDLAGALPLYERGLAVTETDPGLTDLGLLLQINMALTLFELDRCEEALATAERARQLADQVGTVMRLAQAHGALGQLLYLTGRWDDALAEFALVPENLKEPRGACGELAISAMIAVHRDEPQTASRLLAAADPLAPRLGRHHVPLLVLATSVEREQAGAPEEALAILAAAFSENTGDLGEIEDLVADTVRLALKAGDKDTAQTIAGQAAALAVGSQIPHRQANALYCRGIVDRDASTLLAAAQRYADAGRPLPRAKALEAAAECLVLAEERTAARQAFEQSVEVYEFLSAEADINRVQAEFRAHGIRRGPHSKHRRAVSGWDSLTDTELKVAAFVEEGLSNPEIAGRLMLSRRTVATHVSHILKKLDVATRTDIARESALRAVAAR
jgi:DNA-binding CsgD family transcriptional regulator/tetratricopeptide (TPR) repeat protein